MPCGTVISWYLGSDFKEKRAKWLEKIFSSSENVIWSILLKYREIDVQIQAFTGEIEISHIVAFLKGTNCRFVDYKY